MIWNPKDVYSNYEAQLHPKIPSTIQSRLRTSRSTEYLPAGVIRDKENMSERANAFASITARRKTESGNMPLQMNTEYHQRKSKLMQEIESLRKTL